MIVGIDEVGRGSWAGPVVACAFTFLKTFEGHHILRDSKVLSAKKREEVSDLLHEARERGICIFGFGQASVLEIDAWNILQATFLAMRRALESLEFPETAIIRIDGDLLPSWPSLEGRLEAWVKGDARCPEISAASILAKVHRDAYMNDLHETHPYYGWITNKGYGAKAHQDGLRTHGITEHHRRSFSPIRTILNGDIQLKMKSMNFETF